MDEDRVLRTRAREAMKAANLPDRRPELLWGGRGSGATCAVCRKAVGTNEVELELEFTSDQAPGADNYHFHVRCFAAWELELRNGGSNGQSLPQVGNGGIMPTCERNTTNQGERD